MKYAVAGTDVGQEGVAQALASVRSFHQAGDIHHIQERRHFAAQHQVRKTQEALPVR